jgi:hypothetical protein
LEEFLAGGVAPLSCGEERIAYGKDRARGPLAATPENRRWSFRAQD